MTHSSKPLYLVLSNLTVSFFPCNIFCFPFNYDTTMKDPSIQRLAHIIFFLHGSRNSGQALGLNWYTNSYTPTLYDCAHHFRFVTSQRASCRFVSTTYCLSHHNSAPTNLRLSVKLDVKRSKLDFPVGWLLAHLLAPVHN